MHPRRSRQLLVVGMLVSLPAVAAQQRTAGNQESLLEQAERLLQAVAAGEEFDGDVSEQLPILIVIAEHGERQKSDLAIRGLGRMKSKASPAIPMLCTKLDDRNHATRSAAADALVAIGDASVAPLRKLIHSPSARTCAAATEALGRLQLIDLLDLTGLALDPDPRVRAAVANALSRIGKPGVPQLAIHLQDEELAVAVEAARGLQANREDPSIAIPKLIEAVSRPDLGWAAAEALAAYGVEARLGVPAIIKGYPLGPTSRSIRRDAAHRALQHIGPPDERDIEALCECLTHESEEARILAAQSLSLLGTKGRSAAAALEAATQATIEWYVKLEREFESSPSPWRDNSGRVFRAATYLAAAVWDVTHDAERFVHVLEKAALTADYPLSRYASSAWREFTADDCAVVESMLRHSSPHVQHTALDGVVQMGPAAVSLQEVVFELAGGPDAELSRQAMQALAAIGPSLAEAAAPLRKTPRRYDSVARVRDRRRLKIRSDESQAILIRGLQDAEQRRTAIACAQALWNTSNEPVSGKPFYELLSPEGAAALIIEAAGKPEFHHYDAIKILQRPPAAADIVVPYLVDQTASAHWTRHAVSALGAFGEAASRAIKTVETHLDDESPKTRLIAAKSIFQISGDDSHLQRQLRSSFSGRDGRQAYFATLTLTAMGPSAAPFLHFIVEGARTPFETLIEALQSIGTDDAVAVLEKIAKSPDWAQRRPALAALRELRNSDETGSQ